MEKTKIASDDADEQIDRKFYVLKKLSILYVGLNISGKINVFIFLSALHQLAI